MVEFKVVDYNDLIRHTGAAILDRVVRRTPVASGTARDGWTAQSTHSEFIIENAVPYIGVLEEGSSSQAPTGMVRVSLEEAPDIIHDYLRTHK